jgi:hypothetical protein
MGWISNRQRRSLHHEGRLPMQHHPRGKSNEKKKYATGSRCCRDLPALTCAFSPVANVCTVYRVPRTSELFSNLQQLQLFREARFVNGCIVQIWHVDLSQMTDPSSEFLTANQFRVRWLRRSLQLRRGGRSLIALGEAGDVSIEKCSVIDQCRRPKSRKGGLDAVVAVHAALTRRRLQGGWKLSQRNGRRPLRLDQSRLFLEGLWRQG